MSFPACGCFGSDAPSTCADVLGSIADSSAVGFGSASTLDLAERRRRGKTSLEGAGDSRPRGE